MSMSLAERTLIALYQHRMMSTDQLWRLLCPHAASPR